MFSWGLSLTWKRTSKLPIPIGQHVSRSVQTIWDSYPFYHFAMLVSRPNLSRPCEIWPRHFAQHRYIPSANTQPMHRGRFVDRACAVACDKLSNLARSEAGSGDFGIGVIHHLFMCYSPSGQMRGISRGVCIGQSSLGVPPWANTLGPSFLGFFLWVPAHEHET